MRIATTALTAALTITLVSGAEARGYRHTARGYQLHTRSTVPLPPRRGDGGTVFAIVSRAAARNGVPQRLAHAVIHVESGHNCHARNRSGAAGLGQLMPSTARAMGVRNPMSCEQNANGAMAYLGRMFRAAHGNVCAAATAYNQGHVAGCSAYGRRVSHFAGL